jgi:glutamine amidotransferase
MTSVSIVDYGMGNIRSVANAFEALGAETTIVADPDLVQHAERLVLPGVGAFGDGMDKLRRGGWVDELEEAVLRRGTLFLGLCVGMQLLASRGSEHGDHAGLGWVPGSVTRLEPADPDCRVPHVAWNDVVFKKSNGLYNGLGESADFYFVHSFALWPDDTDVVSGFCDHGGEFPASVEVENIYATQFHPEKSQKAGMTVLRNFLECKSAA